MQEAESGAKPSQVSRRFALIAWRFWEDRNRAKPAGVFRFTPTGSQVVVRADLLGDESYGTVYHEYFHFLVHATGASVPVWLDEGLASYWASTRLTAKVAEVGLPDVARLEILRAGHLLPLAELMAVERSSAHYSQSDKAQRFYAQSWALTHYLMVGDRSGQGRQQVVDYLLRIASGDPRPVVAFGDLDELEAALRLYIRKLRFPFYEMEPPAPLPADAFRFRELPKAEATAMVARFRLESRLTRDVEALVDFALEGAPDLVETQLVSGLLGTWNQDYEKAEQAFSRAASLEGATPLAYYGAAVLGAYRDASAEGLAVASEHLERAITVDPGFAPAKARLAELLRRDGACSERAASLIQEARKLYPRLRLYRLKEAQILAHCGRAAESREIARAVVEEVVEAESASAANQVCWNGSLWGFADVVLPACDLATRLEPERWGYLDSRGVARAITGDLAGAAADLRKCLELVGDDWRDAAKAQRGEWARELEAGTNPLDADAVTRFQEDPRAMGLQWGL